MDGIIKPFLVGKMEVRRSSWHYRMYQYWMKMGGQNDWNYQENLCHYCRVVGLWAPKRWFFHARFWKVFRPWMVALIVAMLAVVGMAAWIWPSTLVHTLEWIGIAIGVIVALILLIGGGVIFWDKLKEKSHLIQRYSEWYDDKKETIGNIILITIAALYGLAILSLIGYAAYKHPIIFGIVVGSLVGLAAIIVACVVCVRQWQKVHAEADYGTIKPPSRISSFFSAKTEGIKEGAKLAGQYIIAKKRRICPFISFVD